MIVVHHTARDLAHCARARTSDFELVVLVLAARTCPVSSSCCSIAPKKNIRFLMIGPPIDPPNCCRLNGGFSPLACVWK